VENPYQSPATVVEDASAQDGPFEERMLASRLSRLGAAFIDGLVMMAPVFLVFFAAGTSLIPMSVEDAENISQRTWLFETLTSIATVGVFLAINGYWLATQGQTVGKKLAGIKIVSRENTLVPFGRLIIRRYLLFWIAALIPFVNFLGLINVLFIFRKNRRCLHDDLADTMVVRA